MKRLITTVLLATQAIALSAQQPNKYLEQQDLSDGIARYRQGHYAAAIASLDRYIEASKEKELDFSEALFYRNAAEAQMGRADADVLLLRYLERYPDSPYRAKTYALLGGIYLTQGDYERAVYFYGRIEPHALRAEEEIQVKVRQAYAMMQIPDKQRKAEDIRYLLGSVGDGNSIWHKQARFYGAVLDFQQGQYDAARRALLGVAWPEDLADEAEGYLGQINFAEGKWSTAVGTLEQLWQSRPDMRSRKELQRAAGMSYFHLGDYDNSARLLSSYVASSDESIEPELACALGISQYRMGQYHEAERPLTIAASGSDLTAAVAALYLGQTKIELNNFTEAVLAFEQVEGNTEATADIREAALYNMAITLRQSGSSSFGQAVNAAERFLRNFPQSKYRDDIALLLTEAYYTSKDYASSLASINRIEMPTQSIRIAKQYVLARLGDLAMGEHRYSEAEAYYSQALDIDTSSQYAAEALLGRSQAKYQSDRYPSAAEDALAYVQRFGRSGNDNLANARYTLGYALFNQKQFGRAYAALADFVATPGVSTERIADARTRMGDCLYAQKRMNEATEMYRTAYEQHPTAGATALYRLSEIYGYKEQYDKQMATIDKYLSQYPAAENAAELLYNKGRAAIVGRMPLSTAETSLQKVIRDYPESRWGRMACLELAMLYHHNGQTDRAIVQYKGVIEKYPQSDEARQALSDLRVIYLQADRAEEYASYVEQVGAKDYAAELTQTDKLLFEQAMTRFNNGSANAAVAFEQFLEKYPKGAEANRARLYLAKTYQKESRIDEAARVLATLNNQDVVPEIRSEAQGLLGQLLMDKGDYAQAFALYSDAYKSATSQIAYNNYAVSAIRAAYLLQRHDDLLVIAREVKSSGKLGDEKEVSLFEAKALHAKGRSAEAVTLLHPISKETDTALGAEALVTLAQIKYEVGDLQTAKSLCDKFIKQSTPQQYWLARGFVLLADIYIKMGQPETAKQYLLSLEKNYSGEEADIKEMINSRLSKMN